MPPLVLSLDKLQEGAVHALPLVVLVVGVMYDPNHTVSDLFHRRGLWEASTYVCGHLKLSMVAGSCQDLSRVVCGQTELPKVVLASAAIRLITRIVVVARPTSIPSTSLAMNAHRRNCSC